MKRLLARIRAWLVEILSETRARTELLVLDEFRALHFRIGQLEESLKQHIELPAEHLKAHVTAEISKEFAAVREELHTRVHNAAQEVLHESQTVRRVVCGFCKRMVAGGWLHFGDKIECAECRAKREG